MVWYRYVMPLSHVITIHISVQMWQIYKRGYLSLLVRQILEYTPYRSLNLNVL